MSHTGAGNRAPHPERQATGYAGEEAVPSFELDTVSIGAGDIWSTTGDLARWNAALARPSLLLGEESLQLVFAPHAAITKGFVPLTSAHYGYGWVIGEVQGHPLHFHPGDNAGFNAVNLHLPDHDASVILLSNDEGGGDEDRDLWGIGLRLVTALLRENRGSRTSMIV
jgi:CubicO group peptidase (beta-lactamase class C family)